MERTFEQTVSDLRMLLRDQWPSTTADVTDGAVEYLAGGELRGALLCADDPNGLDEPFDVGSLVRGQVADNLADWFLFPRYTHRPSLSAWELDAPPAEITD